MKKTLLSLMALTMLFAACKKNDDPAPEIGAKVKRITQGAYTIDYEYNVDNSLKTTTEKREEQYWRSFFKYENGKLIALYSTTTPTDNTGELDQKYVYEGNRLVKILTPTNNDPAKDGMMDTLTYKTNGELLSVDNYSLLPEKILRNSDTLTWENGNIVKVVNYYRDGDGKSIRYRTRTFTYDASKSFRTVTGFIYDGGINYENFSKYNIKTLTYEYHQQNNAKDTYNYTYEINSQQQITRVFEDYTSTMANNTPSKDTLMVTYY
jgi:major membrane immunogen (membrane-anchored lipoprotein)